MDQLGDACALGTCISAIQGLASDSASPSDTWLLTFVPESRYENQPIRRAFLKIWIDSSSLKPKDLARVQAFQAKRRRGLKTTLAMLDYELQVSGEVVRSLVDGGICPNFVRYLGGGRGCSVDQVLRLLGSVPNAEERLARSVWYMLLLQRKRPAIDQEQETHRRSGEEMDGGEGGGGKQRKRRRLLGSEDPWEALPAAELFGPLRKHLRFNLLVNEALPPSSTSLRSWMRSQPPQWSLEAKRILCQVMAQGFLAIFAMESAKMNHRDLHAGNLQLLFQSRPGRGEEGEGLEEGALKYMLFGTSFQFVPSVFVLLYDFDWAIVDRLGPNPRQPGEARHVHGRDRRMFAATLKKELAKSGFQTDVSLLLRDCDQADALDLFEQIWQFGQDIGAFPQPTKNGGRGKVWVIDDRVIRRDGRVNRSYIDEEREKFSSV